MRKSFDLPRPSADAIRHSEELTGAIRRDIDAAGGRIEFSRYMDLALYAPGLGYYSAGARKFGTDGDFVTAPELSAIFPACLGRVAADFFRAHPAAGIMEIGAGTGAMAAGILRELAAHDRLPASYRILEVSAELRQRQQDHLARHVPDHVQLVEWLERLPERNFDGLILGNEVVDALPVDRFAVARGDIRSLGVGYSRAGFEWSEAEAPAPLRRAVEAIIEDTGHDWPPRYVSEVNLSLAAWLASIVERLDRGLVLLIDYGLPRRAFYNPERAAGTLNCHYRHRAHDDPFVWPGLQDITAWVDFTAVAEAAVAAGLSVALYTTQAQFLLASGIVDVANVAADAGSVRERVDIAGQLRRLMMPGEMGEAFKLIALEKNLSQLPASLAGRDLSHQL